MALLDVVGGLGCDAVEEADGIAAVGHGDGSPGARFGGFRIAREGSVPRSVGISPVARGVEFRLRVVVAFVARAFVVQVVACPDREAIPALFFVVSRRHVGDSRFLATGFVSGTSRQLAQHLVLERVSDALLRRGGSASLRVQLGGALGRARNVSSPARLFGLAGSFAAVQIEGGVPEDRVEHFPPSPTETGCNKRGKDALQLYFDVNSNDGVDRANNLRL